jgi:L-lactate dehydrogenase complex protein LldG
MTTAAKQTILARVRHALRDVPATEKPSDVPVPQGYRTADTATREQIIEQFIDRVVDYKAAVHRVHAEALPDAIAAACARRGVRRLVVPPDLPDAWIPEGVEPLRDEALSYEALDTSDGVLTGCALGVAQTGTIVLDGGAYQGRRAITLLPDYHLCVIYANQIVGLVPEAITKLSVSTGEVRRPITFVSGPSATSDIELNRVEGVHGPRTLEVLVVLNDRQ